MAEKTALNEILDFAIREEERAAEFYTGLAGTLDRPWMKDVFEGFAREELGHKAKLLAIKAGKMPEPFKGKVPDLKIADYLVDAEPSPEMGYQDALVLAMKFEKAAFRMYSDLADIAEGDDALKNTFLMLAQEEAKHKLRFEVEYDDYVLQQN